jgi:hypothetical protein
MAQTNAALQLACLLAEQAQQQVAHRARWPIMALDPSAEDPDH